MVTMSEMYKNRKKVLIRGAGDLATGVGVALHRAGFRVIMTEIAVPLTVRREVAMSRAVYEGRIEVEGIEGILVENYQEARRVLAADKIAVIVDPEAEIRREFRPDVLVDAILAKRNTGTSRADAPARSSPAGKDTWKTASGRYILRTARPEILRRASRRAARAECSAGFCPAG